MPVANVCGATPGRRLTGKIGCNLFEIFISEIMPGIARPNGTFNARICYKKRLPQLHFNSLLTRTSRIRIIIPPPASRRCTMVFFSWNKNAFKSIYRVLKKLPRKPIS